MWGVNHAIAVRAILAPMHTISGKVIKGLGYGRKIGFPTINLDRREYRRLNLRIREGIYAGTAHIQKTGRRFKAAIIVAQRDRRGLPKIEAYLLGFTGVLYGKKVELSFMKYVRHFMSFRSESALKTQILKDIARVDKIIHLTD